MNTAPMQAAGPVDAQTRPPRGPAAHAVVWMFCPDDEQCIEAGAAAPQTVDRVYVWDPSHVTRRISAQAGAFTVHPDWEGGIFSALEREENVASRLQEIIVSKEDFERIRFHLDRCGINAASIYADIDGLARHIEWQNSYSSDESPWEADEALRLTDAQDVPQE